MQTTDYARISERLFNAILLAYGHKARHFRFCHVDFVAAPIGLGHIRNFKISETHQGLLGNLGEVGLRGLNPPKPYLKLATRIPAESLAGNPKRQ